MFLYKDQRWGPLAAQEIGQQVSIFHGAIEPDLLDPNDKTSGAAV